jgi:predicted metalloprotease
MPYSDDYIDNEFWSLVTEEYGDVSVVDFAQAYEIIHPYPGIYIVIMEENGKETF